MGNIFADTDDIQIFTYKYLIINNYLKTFGELKLTTEFTLAVFL